MIGKRVNGTVTARYLYDGQLKPVAVVDGEGNVERRYLYALHANVPEAILEADGTTYRIIHDHLGSPRMVVNAATGEIVKEVAYDEFGNITTETGAYALPFGFAGGIRDTDTGLTKFGARWYDPEVGRWISKEPLGFAGSMNFYVYAGNDPVNFVDPTGEKLWYANKKAKDAIEPIIQALIAGSKIANHMIYELHSREQIYTIDINNKMKFETYKTTYGGVSVYRGISVDPTVNTINIDRLIEVYTKTGKDDIELMSLERAVAHELGHLYLKKGDKDAYCNEQPWCKNKKYYLGPMSNVVEIENPIMLEYGEPYERKSYYYQ